MNKTLHVDQSIIKKHRWKQLVKKAHEHSHGFTLQLISFTPSKPAKYWKDHSTMKLMNSMKGEKYSFIFDENWRKWIEKIEGEQNNKERDLVIVWRYLSVKRGENKRGEIWELWPMAAKIKGPIKGVDIRGRQNLKKIRHGLQPISLANSQKSRETMNSMNFRINHWTAVKYSQEDAFKLKLETKLFFGLNFYRFNKSKNLGQEMF